MFFAADGMLETAIEVLSDFGPYPKMIAKELAQNLPFLATTKLLVAAVKGGMGREEAHERIKEHAVLAVRSRLDGASSDSLFEMVAADPHIPLTRTEIETLVADPLSFTGTAVAQVATFVATATDLAAANPVAANYRPSAVV